MKSLKAEVLSFEYRKIMIRLPSVAEAESIGKDARINGLKTIGGNKFSPNHPASVLQFTIKDGEDTSSLQGAAHCKVTWD